MTRQPMDVDDPESIRRFIQNMRSPSTSSQNAVEEPADQLEDGEVKIASPPPESIDDFDVDNIGTPMTPVVEPPLDDDCTTPVFSSPECHPRPSPHYHGLMPPYNTPLAVPASPRPIANNDESTIQNPTAVGEALYEYMQNIDGVPLSESMWAPQNRTHGQSLLKGPRVPVNQDLTTVKVVEHNAAINDTFSRMSFKAADASTQTTWSPAKGASVRPPCIVNDTYSAKVSDSAPQSKASDDVSTASQRSAAPPKQRKQKKQDYALQREQPRTGKEQLRPNTGEIVKEVNSEVLSSKDTIAKNPAIAPAQSTALTFRSGTTEMTAVAGDGRQGNQPPAKQVATSLVPPHLRKRTPSSSSATMPGATQKTSSPSDNNAGPAQSVNPRAPIPSVSPKTSESKIKAGNTETLLKETPMNEIPIIEPFMKRSLADSTTQVPQKKRQSQFLSAPHHGAIATPNKEGGSPQEAGDIGTSKPADPSTAVITKKALEGKEELEDREKQIMFTTWGTPEARDRPAAQVRKVILKALPHNSTAAFVASLVFGGALEQIQVRDDGTASVKFLHAADCKRFYEETSNGLVYGKDANERGKIAWVHLAKDVDVVGGLLTQWITSNFTRCVRAVPVDEDFGKEYLWKMASRKNRIVEGIEDAKNPAGSRIIIFRFTDIAHAVQFRAALNRDEEWEHCNITFTKDPCSEATGPRIKQRIIS